MDSHNNINDKWFFIKDKILSELDKISPLKKTIIKPDNKCPWFDLELTKSKSARDSLYAQSVKSKLDIDRTKYKQARKTFKYLNRAKIKIYFENQGTKDFRNSKKFWQFYKSSVKLRSDKSGNEGPNLITYDGQSVSDPVEIVSIFNNFFTSIESVSLSSKDESHSLIDRQF